MAGRRPEWQRDKRIIAGDSLGMNKYIRKWGMCARRGNEEIECGRDRRIRRRRTGEWARVAVDIESTGVRTRPCWQKR